MINPVGVAEWCFDVGSADRAEGRRHDTSEGLGGDLFVVTVAQERLDGAVVVQGGDASGFVCAADDEPAVLFCPAADEAVGHSFSGGDLAQ
jgi:hypothetical protein